MSKRVQEAIYLVLDIGVCMHEKNDFDKAISIVKMIVLRKIFQEYTGCIGLITFNDEETNNGLSSGTDDYNNIAVKQKCGPVTWDFYTSLERLGPSKLQSVDVIEALVVAAHQMKVEMSDTKSLSTRRLLLVSNLSNNVTSYETEYNLQKLTNGFLNEGISVDVICPDLIESRLSIDDCSGLVGTQLAIAKIISRLDGSFFSFSEANKAINTFETREVRPTPINYDLKITESITIPVSMFVWVREKPARPFSVKKVYGQDPDKAIEVETKTVLKENFSEEIDESDVVQGYKYGTKLISISKEERELFPMPSWEKGLALMMFAPAEQVKPYYTLGNGVYQVLCNLKYPGHRSAFAAFIVSLYETNCVAVVRRVHRKGCSPEIGCLQPYLSENEKCLLYTRLPFADDMRMSHWPHAPKSLRLNENQLESAKELVDGLWLMEQDEDGEHELLVPENTPNPLTQNFLRKVSERILHPEREELKTEFTDPIEDFVRERAETDAAVRSSIENFARAFDLLSTSGFVACKAEDAVSSGYGSYSEISDNDDMEESATILADDIVKQNGEQAISILSKLRSTAVESNEPDRFNEIIKTVKKSCNEQLWELIVQNGIKPISNAECKWSYIFPEEAEDFLRLN